ncbi:Methyl-CpG-binding domain-containing protein 6 [Cinnamomum micranthum f. kanehirae]|uniref:Methyl-CpG-binding domain-containing protein 6 n=1 Tax=Cinnamomum micranthum f. kanehirae TaxID=337451 RepID=A0A3S3Q164_9MAGN|nr:Methyl-CpG-binding domain-containing protein 6 [Cinnamomum micranthum f. kanehirae]
MPSEVNPAPLPATMGSRRGRRKKTEEELDEFWSQRPDWLPEGWTMHVKVRKDGATAGIRDRYFYESTTGRRFRSRKEVEKFIKTGEVPRYKPKPKTKESNVVPTSSQNSKPTPSGDMVLPPTLEFYIKNLQSYMSGGINSLK